MSDFFVELGTHKRARKIIGTLGLPVPLPEKLRRDVTPWRERSLHDVDIVVGAAADGDLAPFIAETLATNGANPWVVDDDDLVGTYRKIGEGWGRNPTPLDIDDVPEKLRPRAFVFDATGVKTPEGLRAVYDFFHPRMRSLSRSGRLIVLGRPFDTIKNPVAAASQRALEGFTRAAGRELGRKGATANLITVKRGAEKRLEPVLRFMLSPRSAYVSGQAIHVSTGVAAPKNAPAIRPLENKVVLVTGAARGIGAAIARATAREGAHVICLDRPTDDKLVSVVANEVGGKVLLCDVTDDDAPEKIAAFVKDQYGHIDVVINNAGITRDKTLANMKPEWWDQTIDVNLAAVMRINAALDPLLRKDGRLICLSSIAGISGNVGQTNYAASKAGIIGYVSASAATYKKRGIAINAIAPGFIETRLTAAIPVATREVARRLANLSQGGLPVDIAEVATFLSSPGASGITGQIVRVCGGNFVGA